MEESYDKGKGEGWSSPMSRDIRVRERGGVVL